ncbi:MAG: hypothetical protein LBC74_00400 [Planctomycetaceae bacterium]|nr:hypothetical protein [Planctomycetaceae bacterium]
MLMLVEADWSKLDGVKTVGNGVDICKLNNRTKTFADYGFDLLRLN